MSSVDIQRVRRAIREVFLELTVDLIDPSIIQWENETLEPAELRIEEALQIFYESSAFQSFESRGRDVFDVVVPRGKGAGRAWDTAQIIVNVFEPVYAINRQGVQLYVDKTERGSGQLVGDRYSVPVSVLWRAYASRGTLVIK